MTLVFLCGAVERASTAWLIAAVHGMVRLHSALFGVEKGLYSTVLVCAHTISHSRSKSSHLRGNTGEKHPFVHHKNILGCIFVMFLFVRFEHRITVFD